jgi:hypothetical protein
LQQPKLRVSKIGSNVPRPEPAEMVTSGDSEPIHLQKLMCDFFVGSHGFPVYQVSISLDQSRIAGAINILILKLMGYSGRVCTDSERKGV